ncbi:serine/threonine-protein kinase [Streptomyces sp. NPDC006662]|uniref:serine/threonine-protein kinase n=1 Tax=Streptomyces sp. NPDC006662 TaxID=3156902 RepID=UPI0033F33ED0
MAGEQLLAGRYELVRLVGRGGMGEVWEARDRVIQRSVAVKLLPYGQGDASGADLFFREARTAGALQHPGVVTVHDLGRDAASGSLFLVMELLHGRDLATVLQQGGVPPVAVAVDWVAQVAAALAAAHDAGVVHRDLKPANLMLTVDGRLVILDFGIARFVEATHKSSRVMGTLAYMPPERFLEQPGDSRSDLYSLGCVLYELLTGQVPFRARGAAAMMNAHMGKAPTRPGATRAGVPAALDDLVLVLLAKAPQDRPATAREVEHRLRVLTARRPEHAGPDRTTDVPTDPPTPTIPAPPPGTGPRLPNRRRFLRLGVGAGFAAAAGIGISAALSKAGARWPVHYGTVFGEPMVTGGVVYVGDGNGVLHAIDAKSGDRKWASQIGNSLVSRPSFAAGKLYVAGTDGRLYVVDAATGATQWTYATGGAIYTSTPAVHKGVVYVGSRDRRLHAIDAMSGAKKWTYLVPGSIDPSTPAVVDDVVVITGGMPGTGVHAVDVTSGSARWVYRTDEWQQIDAAPAAVDGVVYVGDGEGRFLAIDVAGGTKKWDISVGEGVLFDSATVADGAAYAYGNNGNLYAVNLATHAVSWTASVDSSTAQTFTPAVARGMVYGGGRDKLYAVDAVTGIKKWTFSGDEKSRFTSPVVDDGVVYVGGGGDHNLYALDASTGRELT